MIAKELDGVDFVVANTDAQALQQSSAPSRVQLGVKVTEGLGAGARPSVGSAAAEESIEQIVDHLAGSHMCFITAGMGGGTGTGAAPIIAQAARELGVLTVGVVTKPFQFEGAKRMRQAEEGVEALQKVVDTLIIIPNQNLFRLANEKTTFTEAFSMADDVLYQGVKGVTDLMVRPGLINLDFADVRAVMDEMGKAMMGTGEAEGEDRAIQAAEKAIANPLLDEISLRGAKGVLINIPVVTISPCSNWTKPPTAFVNRSIRTRTSSSARPWIPPWKAACGCPSSPPASTLPKCRPTSRSRAAPWLRR
jgi:cell division protein FtsZ